VHIYKKSRKIEAKHNMNYNFLIDM